jgi:hypothetical protein
MKFTRLALVLTFAAFFATFTAASADSFDSATATIQKSGPHTAKVMVGKETYMAPIHFADGADWSMVKDHYEVADPVVAGLKKHKIVISVGADGGASFTRKK